MLYYCECPDLIVCIFDRLVLERADELELSTDNLLLVPLLDGLVTSLIRTSKGMG